MKKGRRRYKQIMFPSESYGTPFFNLWVAIFVKVSARSTRKFSKACDLENHIEEMIKPIRLDILTKLRNYRRRRVVS